MSVATWVRQDRSPAIAVLSDHRAAHAAAALADDVGALGGFDADAVAFPTSGAGLPSRLERLPERFHAALLVQLDPLAAREAGEQALERGLPLVVSDHDGVAAALCAAVLTHLRAIGRPVERARVAVAGGANLPSMAPLLMIAGVYDLLLWQDSDATFFPWAQIVRDADVVIDLRTGPAAVAETRRIALDRPDGSVLQPADAAWDHHVIAAVLRVALACPPGSMHVEVGMLRACAAAIVAVSPPGHARIPDSAITEAVEAAVRRSIDPRLAAFGVVEGREER